MTTQTNRHGTDTGNQGQLQTSYYQTDSQKKAKGQHGAAKAKSGDPDCMEEDGDIDDELCADGIGDDEAPDREGGYTSVKVQVDIKKGTELEARERRCWQDVGNNTGPAIVQSV